MFSAFSSHSVRARTPSEIAVKRLDGIGHVLSDLALADVQTEDDLTRALMTLDTADKCIRVIRAEFRTQVANDRLARKTEDLMALIERVHDELTGCCTVKS